MVKDQSGGSQHHCAAAVRGVSGNFANDPESASEAARKCGWQWQE